MTVWCEGEIVEVFFITRRHYLGMMVRVVFFLKLVCCPCLSFLIGSALDSGLFRAASGQLVLMEGGIHC